MHITKLGHCCLLIKVDGVTILTDPGAYSDKQNTVSGVDVVLITHEHPDHLHVDSLKEVLKNNPNAKIISNAGVGAKLDEVGIPYSLLQGRETGDAHGVPLEAFDCKHEEIFEEFGQVQNTGYLIAKRLFYPGDAFFDPQRPIDILALPVAGPWCTIADAVHYALTVKPKKAFPVHDGMFLPGRGNVSHNLPGKILPENGIEFIPLKEGDELSC